MSEAFAFMPFEEAKASLVPAQREPLRVEDEEPFEFAPFPEEAQWTPEEMEQNTQSSWWGLTGKKFETFLPSVISGLASFQADRALVDPFSNEAPPMEYVQTPEQKLMAENAAGVRAEIEHDLQIARPADTSWLGDVGSSSVVTLPQLVLPFTAQKFGWIGLETAFAAAMVPAGVQAGAEAYGEASDYRDPVTGKPVSVGMKTSIAAINAAAEIVLEKWGLGDIFKGEKPLLQKHIRDFFLKELSGEELTTIIQSLSVKYGYDPEKWDSLDEIADDLAATAIGTLINAGAIGVTGKGIDVYKNRKEQIFSNFTGPKAVDKELDGTNVDLVSAGMVGATGAPLDAATEKAAAIKKWQLEHGIENVTVPEDAKFGLIVDTAFAPVLERMQGDKGRVTPEVAERRQADLEENGPPLPVSEMVVYGSNDKAVTGLQVKNLGSMPAGGIVIIGDPTQEKNFPPELHQPMLESAMAFQRRYGIRAPIIIGLMPLPMDESNLMGYYSAVNIAGVDTHLIVPRDLPSWSHETGDKRTKLNFLSSFWHEVTHALGYDRFWKGITSRLVAKIRSGNFTQADLIDTQHPIEGTLIPQAPLILKWQELRERALSGKMTVREYIQSWMGVSKIGAAIQKPANKHTGKPSWDEFWVLANVRGQYDKENLDRPVRDMLKGPMENGTISQEDLDYFFGFDEFFAEQGTRHAYSTGAMAKGKLGQQFADTMAALRDLFSWIKRQPNGPEIVKRIAPTMEFSEWMSWQKARAKSDGFKPQKWAKRQAAVPATVTEGEDKKPKPTVQVPEAVNNADIVADLQDTLDDLYSVGAISIEMYERMGDRLARGTQDEILSVESYINKIMEKEDRKEVHAISRLYENMREDGGLYTEQRLNTIINALQLSDKDKMLVKEFFAENDVAGMTRDDLLEAIQNKGVPLSVRVTASQANYGTEGLGLRDATTVILNAPFVTMGPSGEGGSNHFPQFPNYVGHYRVAFNPSGKVYILELQSDLLQSSKRLNATSPDALTRLRRIRKGWESYQLENVLAQFTARGMESIMFPTGDMAALIEGWRYIPPADGEPIPLAALKVQEINHATIDHLGEVSYFDAEGNDVSWSVKPENKMLQIGDILKLRRAVHAKAAYGVQSSKTGEWSSIDHLFDSYDKGRLAELKKHGPVLKIDDIHGEWYSFSTANFAAAQKGLHTKKTLSKVPSIKPVALAGLSKYTTTADAQTAARAWERDGMKATHVQEFFKDSVLKYRDGEPIPLYLTGHVLANATGDMVLSFTDDRTSAQRDDGEPPQVFYVSTKDLKVMNMEGQKYNEKLPNVMDSLGFDDVLAIKTATQTQYFLADTQKIVNLSDNSIELGGFAGTWDHDGFAQNIIRSSMSGMKNLTPIDHIKSLHLGAKIYDSTMQLRQIVRDNPGVRPLQRFATMVQQGIALGNGMQSEGERTTKHMLELLGPKQKGAEAIRKVMEQEQTLGLLCNVIGYDISGQEFWRLTDNTPVPPEVVTFQVVETEELLEAFNRLGFDPTTKRGRHVVDSYMGVRRSLMNQWCGLEYALRRRFEMNYGEDNPVFLNLQHQLIEEINHLRTSAFMPNGQFGKYALVVTDLVEVVDPATGETRRVRRPIYNSRYENKDEWVKAHLEYQRMAAAHASVRVTARELDIEDDLNFLPTQLSSSLTELLAATNLYTEEQLDQIRQLATPAILTNMARRFERLGSNVPGGSTDFIRTFSDFTLKNASYIKKLYMAPFLESTIAEQKRDMRRVSRDRALAPEDKVEQLEEMSRLLRIMVNAKNYLLHPQAEFQAMRSFISLAFLSFMVKTAAVNLSTQLNTIAAITSEYPFFDAIKIYTQALYDTVSIPWLQARIDRAKGAEKERLLAQQMMLNRGITEGVFDQSFAYFLAGQADAAAFGSAVGKNFGIVFGNFVSTYGMYLFRMVEKGNRISTMFAMVEAERQRLERERASDTLTSEERAERESQLYNFGIRRVDDLQNSYTQADKSPFMRGKMGLATIFLSFAVFQGNIMLGGYERGVNAERVLQGREKLNPALGPTVKLWLIYAALGGGMGLPFAENIMNILQFIWRRCFGNPENLIIEARKFVKDAGMDPDIIQYGLLHDVGGFNLSNSFSLGKLLPMPDLNRKYDNSAELIGNAFIGMTGPAGSFAESMLEVVGELSDGKPMEAAKRAPGLIGAVSKTLDAYTLQEARPTYGLVAKDGSRLTRDPKTGEFRDLTNVELLGMALGANPTIKAVNQEQRWRVTGEQMYWTTRRSNLIAAWVQARELGDEADKAAVDKQVAKYNSQVPSPAMKLSGKALVNSYKQRLRGERAVEATGVKGKMYRGLAQEIE
jgi:hypothetical protein